MIGGGVEGEDEPTFPPVLPNEEEPHVLILPIRPIF